MPGPASRLPLSEQPGCDAILAVLLGDAEVADVGPGAGAGEPFARRERLHLDVAGDIVAGHRGKARAVDSDRKVNAIQNIAHAPSGSASPNTGAHHA